MNAKQSIINGFQNAYNTCVEDMNDDMKMNTDYETIDDAHENDDPSYDEYQREIDELHGIIEMLNKHDDAIFEIIFDSINE